MLNFKAVILGLLIGPAVLAETVVIEATGPNVSGEKVFKCARLESRQLIPSTKNVGRWVAVPKSNRVEGCDAGIMPGRNYHVYILMEVWNDGQLTKTYNLPPYFVWIAPPIEPKPMPPGNLTVS
jgi:hypothetical protein